MIAMGLGRRAGLRETTVEDEEGWNERNAEIRDLLQEDSEAVYFSDDKELLEKVTYWLSNESGRRSIAGQGFEAISMGNFRHEDRLVSVFDALGQDSY